jgi:hypothetical protein
MAASCCGNGMIMAQFVFIVPQSRQDAGHLAQMACIAP